MDDEFALCWNNFQENLASGFQSLFDRGDLVDVTLACDGKLLQAHKIVLAICSPYFQDMFVTNPCRHPIIILKDVSHTVMSELLQFMYQGVVNVKHTELSSFMKIAQALQIKGLATSTSHQHGSRAIISSPPLSGGPSSLSQMAASKPLPPAGAGPSADNFASIYGSSNPPAAGGAPQKRLSATAGGDYNNGPAGDTISSIPKKLFKRTTESAEHEISGAESMENLSSDEVFMAGIPQISMVEVNRFDLANVKRESVDGGPAVVPGSAGSSRNNLPSQLNFDYNGSAYSKTVEYPNELHINKTMSDVANCGSASGTHGDIQSGGGITMLSSTSLLHGNCIFNRNNTVATQQGMKTYWLCKSYRITMCRARCITHQGRVISATGVHNHQPHMKGSHSFSSNEYATPTGPSGSNNGTIGAGGHPTLRLPLLPPTSNIPVSQPSSVQHISLGHMSHSQHHHHSLQPTDAGPEHHQSPSPHGGPHHHHHSEHHHHHHQAAVTGAQSATAAAANSSIALQNMIQSVLSPNNLLHQSHIAQLPMLNSLHHHAHGPHTSSGHSTPQMPPSSLQITSIMSNQSLHSPESPGDPTEHGHHLTHSQQHGHSAHGGHHGHAQQHIHQQESSPRLQHHQALAASTSTGTVSVSAVGAAAQSEPSPISPQQRQQQTAQHCDNLSPEAESHSMASDSTILSNMSMAQQPPFKMEQI